MTDPRLHVAIIGAGLGGLAAAIGIRRVGHNVTLLEQSAQFHHVSAPASRSPPNAAHILSVWGLIPEIAKHSVQPSELRLRAWKDGKILHRTPLRCEDTYGAGMYFIHRADFHTVLVDEARRLGVDIRLGSTVSRIDFDNARVEIVGKEAVKADAVIGADGLNSICRETLLGRKDPPHRTGDLAYRLTVKEADMRNHPDLHELVEDIPNDLWLGPNTFVVGYLLKENGYYNIALICPDTMPEDTDVSKATSQEMRELLEGWDPRLQALLSLVEQTQKWRMLTSRELAEWRHPQGRFALLGDACHASLPYLAQGAAMALEDGAVLGELFARITDASQIPGVLEMYEALRKQRTTRVVQGSLNQGKACKLRDGEEQEERDRMFATGGLGEYSFPVATPSFRDWLMGYDAFAEVEKVWKSEKRRQAGIP